MSTPVATPPSTPPDRERRPDESMTLLTSMMERPLDPGYAAAAAQREQRGLPPATPLRTGRMFVIALLVGLLLTAGALSLRQPDTEATSARANLIEQIQRRQTSADARADQVRGLQEEVATAQAVALERDRSGQGERLARLETAAGGSPVQGPGVVLTLDDAESSDDSGSTEGDPRASTDDNGRVQSRDVQLVVNGLWAAGAEAIAINGQRLTSLSAIRFAGEAILVNYRPLVRPYEIAAIGGSELEARFAAGPGGSYLQALRDNYAIRVDVAGDTALTLPSAASVNVRVARPPTGTGAAEQSRIESSSPTSTETPQ